MNIQVKSNKFREGPPVYELWVNGKVHSLHQSHARAWRMADKLTDDPHNAKEYRHEWSSRHND